MVTARMKNTSQNPRRRFPTKTVFFAFLAILISSAAPVSFAQNFSLGGARKVPPPHTGLPIYKYSPDGHCTVFQTDSDVWMFWPGVDSYRSSGPSLFEMFDCEKVLSPGPQGGFDSGGAWLYTVLRGKEGRMLGFYHAEDKKFPLNPESNFIAYKSIARCVSEDSGLTWKKREQILTSHEPKPRRAAWSGLGDHCIVWNSQASRLMCFFQEKGQLCVAMSRDSQGNVGSWRKWYQGSFSEPGLGGRVTPIPAFARHPGGNPSVLWNTFLQRWLIAWHGWGGDLWISSSTNLMDWSPPKILLKKPPGKAKAWYPTLVGTSDKVGGERLRLLYAEFSDGEKYERRFLVRQMRLKK
jgi:hypothetical protein